MLTITVTSVKIIFKLLSWKDEWNFVQYLHVIHILSVDNGNLNLREISFCKEKKFLLTTFLTNFWKLWMFLLLLYLASIIQVAFCRRSCQPTYSTPPSSACTEAVSSPLSCAPTLSCAGAPLLHHPSWVKVLGCLHQPPEDLHGFWCYAWQSAMPRQTARPQCSGQASLRPPRWSSYQVGLVFRPAGFVTFSLGTARRLSRNRFSPTLWGVFAHPGPAATSSPPQTPCPQQQRTPPRG